MIYLMRPDGQIAACEQEARARRCEGGGFTRCSYEEYMNGWIDRDMWTLAILRSEARDRLRLQERAVGETVGDAPGLPGGRKLYKS